MKILMLYDTRKNPMRLTLSGRFQDLKQIRGTYSAEQFNRFGGRKRSSNIVEMPLTPLALKIVKQQFPQTRVHPDVVEWYSNELRRREDLANTFERRDLQHNPRGLYRFQRRGVSFMFYSPKMLLGDDPRLGKTVQSLTAMELLHPYRRYNTPIVVFALKSLLEYWEDAVRQWTDFNPIIVHGPTATRLERLAQAGPDSVVITNWETLRYVKKFPKGLFSRIIGDECHIIRNRKAAVSKAFMRLRPDIAYLMSATMIERGPEDYFPMLKVVRPFEHASYWRWVGWFCQTRFNGFGHDIVDSQNEDLLADYMAPFSLRRKASEVANMPKKIWETLRVEPSAELMSLYREIEKKVVVELDEDKTLIIPNALARTVRLRQVSIAPQLFGAAMMSPKIDAIIDYINTLPQNMQIVVYTTFREPAFLLSKMIESASLFVGGEKFPKEFTEGKKRVLVATPFVGGVGLDLSCADAIIYADLPQSSTILRQSIERTSKIGITKPRLIVSVVCTPIDTAMTKALIAKQENIRDVDIYQHIMNYLGK